MRLIYVCVCVCVCVYVCARVRVGVGVVARALACACARVALLIQHVTRCHIVICGLSGSTIVFDIISQTARFSGKKLLNIKRVFCFSLQMLFETFLILRRIQRDIVKNVKTTFCEVSVILFGF